MRRIVIVLAAVGALGLGGCANMSETEQRVLSGGAIGTATGAAAAVLTGGSTVAGAVIGGAVGSAGGYLYDRHEKEQEGQD